MGFNFSFRKKQKVGTLITHYVKERNKEKQSYTEQLERLVAQLQDGTIDQLEHDRLRDLLDANYFQQQQEAWSHVQNKYSTLFVS